METKKSLPKILIFKDIIEYNNKNLAFKTKGIKFIIPELGHTRIYTTDKIRGDYQYEEE